MTVLEATSQGDVVPLLDFCGVHRGIRLKKNSDTLHHAWMMCEYLDEAFLGKSVETGAARMATTFTERDPQFIPFFGAFEA